MRLFIAVNLPDAEKTRLAHALQAVAVPDLPARWVESDSLHITLKFLGEVPQARLPAVTAALAEAVDGAAAFAVALDGFGAFPSLSRPSILCLLHYRARRLRSLTSESPDYRAQCSDRSNQSHRRFLPPTI